MPFSNVAILNKCDSHPSPLRDPKGYSEALSNYALFQCNGVTLGYLLAPVVAALRSAKCEDWNLSGTIVEFNTANNTFEKRTAVMKATVGTWREEKRFQVLEGKARVDETDVGWRNELYSIYGLNGEVLFAMERCAAPLFGVVTYGVHMTVYIPPTQFQPMRIWTPKRSESKFTYPGMLDNSVLPYCFCLTQVAGGIAHGMSVLDTLVKEADEEASLPADIVRTQAVAAGAVSYFYVREASAGGEEGLLQPEVQYVYDLEITEEIILKPNDDEMEAFSLMPLHEVLSLSIGL